MIGIIGAMDIEIDALKAELSGVKSEVISGVEFTSGNLYGHPVVMAVCGIGKVFAAICAQTMILKYGVSCVINTGVGGSLSEELGVGDIAIADYAVQHDMDTTPLGDPAGLLSGINIVKLPANKELCERLTAVTSRLGIKNLLCTVASGDQFIASPEQKDRIVHEFGAAACEMEGAAIAHVCYVNNVPFAIVRSISDNANGKSSVDYPTFRKIAADNSKRVILELIKDM